MLYFTYFKLWRQNEITLLSTEKRKCNHQDKSQSSNFGTFGLSPHLIQRLSCTWLVTTESEWPFGLQWNTLGKLFSLYSFKNSNCSTSFKILCQGNSINISLRSLQDFLHFFHPVNSPGFSMTHNNCPQKNKYTFHLTDSAVALVSPSGSHQTWEEEVPRGRQEVGHPQFTASSPTSYSECWGHSLSIFLSTTPKGQLPV